MEHSKEFDCLPHEHTLAKLYAYGVDMKNLELLQVYLSNRSQRFKLNSTFSSWFEILLEVPEGSILGLLLFNIFLNNLLWFHEKTDISNFAYDNTLNSCAQSIDDVVENLLYDLTTKYANPGKIQFMI